MSNIAAYDREALRTQFRAAQPFPWIKLDGFLRPEFAAEVAASYPPFEVAVGMGRQFKSVTENRKVQIVDYAKFPQPVQRLSDALSDPAFMEDLAYITGIPNLAWDPSITGGGMHETARSGWLDVHVDFNFNRQLNAHRRLNILIFFNPLWDESWGGILELWDRDVQNRAHAFAPILNRCVIFEPSNISWHGVTAVDCPEGVIRKSYAAYYYTAEAPPGWDGTSHTTIFRARPNEYLKRYALIPAESARLSTIAGARKAKRAVQRWLGRPDT
jgi:hypothetical protein